MTLMMTRTRQNPPPYLYIAVDSPAVGANFYGSTSQGVTITASGNVGFHRFTVQSVEVRIGNSAFVPVQLSSANTWTRTSNKITTGGPLSIVARVTGKRHGGTQTQTRTATRTVTVNITDDIPPTVAISQPPNGFQVPDVNGKFNVTLQGTAEDNASGIKQVEYSLDGVNWVVITTPTPTNWQTTVKLNFKLGPQTILVRAKDGAGRYSAVSQRTVVTVDMTKPALEITLPKDGVDLPGTDAAGAILPRLEGRATDAHSGVQRVEWALNPQANSP
jgi:Bacterial Ig domain